MGPRCVALVVLVCVAACGPPPPPRPARAHELRSLSEARALEVVREALMDAQMTGASGWEIDVGEARVRVDVRLAGTGFGVEWASAQDRVELGATLPEPAPDGQLQILPGRSEEQDVQVLVLDARTYRYDPERERVQVGSVGISEAEGRLRRDVQDFVEYVRGQL